MVEVQASACLVGFASCFAGNKLKLELQLLRQCQNFRAQLADELTGQPFVKRTGHGFFPGHMAVGKKNVGPLRMPEMAVGLVVEILIIRLQIHIIKFLEHRMRRRRRSLKRVDLRGIGK